ncbi:LysR family transcriptional regulator [Amycolatopsis antarctica]|uniref:LysR family transcriptional regulator n=1 Tax=Amycolatopsis antarctica TaxID=1854586 RepID=A0A263D9I3_9PSEU|nr:LysR family transcriptional regulator [Amycolatopsis antarctica]OZM75123.1 LysR family transcriptional regulator [Amycolatopsis antarctica]
MTDETDALSSDHQLAADIAPDLALLVALGRMGNVTRAAELLGVPQPTVSRRLAALAERVGAPLTLPAGRGIQLTSVAKLLVAGAERALAELAAGARQAREELEPGRGHVVLGFLHLLGRSLVPELLREFRRNHPHVRFRLVQGSRDDVLAHLRAGEVDLAFVAPLPTGDDTLAGHVMSEQELLLSVPESHRLAGRRQVRVAELAEEDFVMLERGYGVRQITDELCAAAGFRPRITFEGQESDTVRGLVAAGLGVALLPQFEPALPAGVVELPLRPRATRSIGLVWRDGLYLTPAVRTFREFVLTR